jgi:hypothetical protein
MSASPNFVSYRRSTQARAEAAFSTAFYGWRLEDGLFLERLELYFAAQVATTTAFDIRVAVGGIEPTSIAQLDSMDIQFVATRGSDLTSGDIQVMSSGNLMIPLRHLVVAPNLVLAIGWRPNAVMSLTASLVVS